MKPTNDFPHSSGASPEIVCGGHKKDPDPQHRGLLKSRAPLTHGPNIESINYPFTMVAGQCTQAALETNDPPPEPGSLILKLPILGEPGSKVGLCTLKDTNMASASAGNMNNMAFAPIVAALMADVEKVVSNGFQSAQRAGAQIRKPKDGENWFHNLTKGLPTHAATKPLAGTIIPSRQNIDTAKQQFIDVLGSDMLSKLPGQFMSLTDLFSGMSKKQKKQAMANMPEETALAFQSTIKLLQEGDEGDYAVGGRVNANSYIANAVTLLSQVTNVPDLHDALHRLQYDTTIGGDPGKVTIEIKTPFGNVKQQIDSTGSTSNEVPDAVQQAIAAFTSMLSSASAAQGASPGKNMFGDMSGTMADMLGRIAPEVQQYRKQILEYLNTSTDAIKMKQMTDLGGRQNPGDPLSLIG